jgi:hypothetical protein
MGLMDSRLRGNDAGRIASSLLFLPAFELSFVMALTSHARTLLWHDDETFGDNKYAAIHLNVL